MLSVHEAHCLTQLLVSVYIAVTLLTRDPEISLFLDNLDRTVCCCKTKSVSQPEQITSATVAIKNDHKVFKTCAHCVK